MAFEAVANQPYLRPCPFCGCKVHLEKSVSWDGSYYVLRGEHDKECYLYMKLCSEDDRTTLVKSWNTRKGARGK